MNVLRSVLYMPGSNSRALEKARVLTADAFIFDIEDAVAPASKAIARQNILTALRQGGYSGQVIVRINAIDTPWWKDDLKGLTDLPIVAVLLAKPNTPDDIATCLQEMDANGMHDMPLWIMAESPKSIANIELLVTCSPRVSAVVMGTSDLAKELRLPTDPNRQGLQYALSRCVNAARMAGVDIIDGVFGQLDDEDGFVSQCMQGYQLGFDGKSLVHPKQIDACHRIFSPSEELLMQSANIVAAWQDADPSSGIVVVDGKMVEELHVQEARRVLAIQQYIDKRSA